MGRCLRSVAVLVFATSSLIGDQVSGAETKCYNWVEARSIIARHGLVPAQDINRAVRLRGGKSIRLNLCKRDNKFIYIMSILGPRGRVRNVTVNAHHRTPRAARSGKNADSYFASPIPRFRKKRRPSPGFRKYLPDFLRR